MKNIVLGLIALGVVVLIFILIGTLFFSNNEVIFDSKGGTSVPVQIIRVGDKVVEPDTPLLNGYVFEGWFLGDEKFDFNTIIEDDITLTGKWSSILNKVSYGMLYLF